ncbi:MAG: DUF1638 domain-containing protein [Treponema sp.]|jgi:hypothetical protein|nr:DUF1638 domain-containing protein [Treponema sp.]
MIKHGGLNKGDVILACSMLEDEIALAMKKTGCRLPVIWLERGLHEWPDRLREELHRRIRQLAAADTILLTYSLCGGALAGLDSSNSRLVLPCFHDCIQMCCSLAEQQPRPVDPRSFYFTRGWLRGEHSTARSFQRACQKYGRKTARVLYREIFKNYRSLVLLDTGAYPPEESLAGVRRLGKTFGLAVRECPGSTRILEKLFSGRWDQEFCIIPPGAQVRQELFLYGGV